MDQFKKGNRVRLTLATATKVKGSIGTIVGRRNEMNIQVLFDGDKKSQSVAQSRMEPYKTFVVSEPVMLLEGRGGYLQGSVVYIVTIDLEKQTADVVWRGEIIRGIPVNVPLSILRKWDASTDAVETDNQERSGKEKTNG
jgi:hypothetical protein